MDAAYSLLLRAFDGADPGPFLLSLLHDQTLPYEEAAWLCQNQLERVLQDSAVVSLDASGWAVRFQSHQVGHSNSKTRKLET